MPAWATILLFADFVVSVIVFPAVEKRAKHLLIPMAFFRDRTFSVEILTASILGGAQMAFEVHFPMWLQAIYRLSASLSGLRITPSSLLWVGASFFVSMLTRRFSPKHLAIPIIAVQTLVYATLLFSGTSYPIVMFHVAAGATGTGFDIIVSSTMVVAQAVVPQEQVGAATSMTTLGRMVGQAVLTGVFGLMFNLSVGRSLAGQRLITQTTINKAISTDSGLKAGAARKSAIDSTLLTAFHFIFLLVVALFLATIVINLFDPMRTPLLKKETSAQEARAEIAEEESGVESADL